MNRSPTANSISNDHYVSSQPTSPSSSSTSPSPPSPNAATCRRSGASSPSPKTSDSTSQKKALFPTPGRYVSRNNSISCCPCSSSPSAPEKRPSGSCPFSSCSASPSAVSC